MMNSQAQIVTVTIIKGYKKYKMFGKQKSLKDEKLKKLNSMFRKIQNKNLKKKQIQVENKKSRNLFNKILQYLKQKKILI